MANNGGSYLDDTFWRTTPPKCQGLGEWNVAMGCVNSDVSTISFSRPPSLLGPPDPSLGGQNKQHVMHMGYLKTLLPYRQLIHMPHAGCIWHFAINRSSTQEAGIMPGQANSNKYRGRPYSGHTVYTREAHPALFILFFDAAFFFMFFQISYSGTSRDCIFSAWFVRCYLSKQVLTGARNTWATEYHHRTSPASHLIHPQCRR
jgi:hypothetical protein